MKALTAEQHAELDHALRTRAERLARRTGMDADDLAQEGNVGTLLALKQFDPARGKLMTFLIAKGELAMLDHVRGPMGFGRSAKPRPTKLSLDHTTADGELSLEFGENDIAPDEVAVHDLMVAAGLDVREWKLTLLRLRGVQQDECAALLGVSTTRIPQLLTRIQSKLKLALGGKRSSRAVEHHVGEYDLLPNVFKHPVRPVPASIFA